MSLTPQQKAALTRKYNKAREEKEALEAQESVHAMRRPLLSMDSNCFIFAPRVPVWLSATGKKRAAPEPSVSVRQKIPKRASDSTSRVPPPDIDNESGDEPLQPVPPPAKGNKSKSTTTIPKTSRRSAKKEEPPEQRPRTLQTPVALAKAPPGPDGADDQSPSEDDRHSHDSNEFQDEEIDEDDDVDPAQLKAETVTWGMDVDNEDHTSDNVRSFRSHSRNSSISSGYDLHVPSSESEPASDVEEPDDSELSKSQVAGNDSDDEGWLQKVVRSMLLPGDESPILVLSCPTSSPIRTKVTTRPNQACVVLVTPTRRRDVMSRAQKLIINSHHATESLTAKIAVVAVTFIHHLSNINSGSGNPIVNSMLALRTSKKSSTHCRQPLAKAIRERPVWAAVDDQDHLDPNPSGPSQRVQARAKKAAVALPSEDWPGTPSLIFTSRGVLNLNDQDPKIQTILRNTFHKVNGDILYLNAFPDVGERLKYSRSALYSICKQLKYAAIAQRLGNDEAYSKEIAKVADARWTETRRSFKQAAISPSIHSFDLKVGCSERVQLLLASPYSDYIYPIKDGVPDYDKPFGNQAVVSTIHQSVFVGKRNLATTYLDRMPVTDGPTPERMISKPIAALAATAVYATLQDWQGPQYVNGEFNANLFAETYLNVLVRLYREASGQGRAIAPRATTGPNVLAHLNLAALEAATH
ncbi:hypothetical protein B0H13DRAFT_2301219 [Mycena leptocephala]|nr:hypothetical protein B0H13DRAFT_2301219 [Mycena leptocephala]